MNCGLRIQDRPAAGRLACGLPLVQNEPNWESETCETKPIRPLPE